MCTVPKSRYKYQASKWKVTSKLTDLIEQVANNFNIHLIQILFINAVGKIASCTISHQLMNDSIHAENLHVRIINSQSMHHQQLCQAISIPCKSTVTVISQASLVTYCMGRNLSLKSPQHLFTTVEVWSSTSVLYNTKHLILIIIVVGWHGGICYYRRSNMSQMCKNTDKPITWLCITQLYMRQSLKYSNLYYLVLSLCIQNSQSIHH